VETLRSVFVIIRLLLGSILVVSGFEKLISPYQNFLYVVQSYDMLPASLEGWVAKVFPWLEFFIGVFVVLGLWLKKILWAQAGIFLVFILVVGQALVRRLPLSECGCFGDLISFPPQTVIVMDIGFFVLTCLCLMRVKETNRFSLDRLFGEG